FDGLTVNLDPANVGISSLAVTASRSEVDETDLVDFAEIHLVQQDTLRLHSIYVQLEPSHVGKVKLAFLKIKGVGVHMISYQPCSIREFHEGANLVKARRLRVPSDPGFARQIHVTFLVPERHGASRRTKARPDVRHAAFIIDG